MYRVRLQDSSSADSLLTMTHRARIYQPRVRLTNRLNRRRRIFLASLGGAVGIARVVAACAPPC